MYGVIFIFQTNSTSIYVLEVATTFNFVFTLFFLFRFLRIKVFSSNPYPSCFPFQAKQNGERLQKFYLDVQKRDPKAFDGLVRSLVASGNFEAAHILDPTVKVNANARGQRATQARNE